MEGTLDGEANPYIDCSVGALVWVRRRNGSWWPGCLLAPEELPQSHLLSPRTGTPVKLLGREDGSVDWYNIQKSRRVKAFRCGEFDDCIEKARSLASLLTKKREKYARREDAILHALELERKYAEQRTSLEICPSARNYKEHSNFADENVLDDDFGSGFINTESSPVAVHASLDGFSPHGNRTFRDSEWEDDAADGIARMQGLQDFGLKISTAKEKQMIWSSIYGGFSRDLCAEDQKLLCCASKSSGSFPAQSNAKVPYYAAALKRKRSQAGINPLESEYKRRDCGKFLNQTLENSLQDFEVDYEVSIPHFNPFDGNSHSHSNDRQERILGFSEEALQGLQNLGSLSIENVHTSQSGHRPCVEMLDSEPALNKACSSSYSYGKTNGCVERQSLYTAPLRRQASLIGSTFVNSLLRRTTAARYPFKEGSPPMGSTSRAKDSSYSKKDAASNLTCFPSFQGWPTHCDGQSACKRVGNDFSMLVHAANTENLVPEFVLNPYKSAVQRNNLPSHEFNRNGLEGCDPNHGEGTQGNNSPSNVDSHFSRCTNPSKPGCLMGSKEIRECIIGDDEVDSVLLIPGSGGLLKEELCDEHESYEDVGALLKNHLDNGFSTVCDQSNRPVESKNHYATCHEFTKPRLGINDENSFVCIMNRKDQPTDASSMNSGDCVSKWHFKGRRKSRGHVRHNSKWTSINLRDIINDGHERVTHNQEKARAPVHGITAYGRPAKGLNISGKDGFKAKKDTGATIMVNTSVDDGLNSVKMGGSGSSGWVSIPIKGQKTIQAERVKIVSVVSKLSGMPIVGQTVVVETFTGGTTPGGNSQGNLPVRPVWRTARRRTSMLRVPRICASAITQGCNWSPDAVKKLKGPQTLNSYIEPPSGKDRMKLQRKNSNLNAPPRCLNRSQRRIGVCVQRTRMLSSIECGQNTVLGAAKATEPPIVTCIPVNLVFSRIREVLYKQEAYPASESDGISADATEKKELA